MRVAYDIGNAAYLRANNFDQTGIARATKLMSRALEGEENIRLIHASKRSQLANAKRYSSELTGLLEPVAEVLSLDEVPKAMRPPSTFTTHVDLLHLNWRGADALNGFEGLPLMIHIPDLIAQKHPEFFEKRAIQGIVDYQTSLLTKPDPRHYFLVNTEEVETDILSLFPRVSREQIVIVPLYSDLDYWPGSAMSQETLAIHKLPRSPYILSVATFEPRKNLKTLVSAYELLAREVTPHPIPQLVLVGSKGWLSGIDGEQVERIRKLPNANIVNLGYVSEGELAHLYQNASLFCFPSLSEGFGLPVYEALNFGTPTIVSDIPAFYSLSAKDVMKFSPTDTEALSMILGTSMGPEGTLQHWSRRAIEAGRHFSRERTANELSAAYARVTASAGGRRSQTIIETIDSAAGGEFSMDRVGYPPGIPRVWLVGARTPRSQLEAIRGSDAVVWLDEGDDPSTLLKCAVFLRLSEVTMAISRASSKTSNLSLLDFVSGFGASKILYDADYQELRELGSFEQFTAISKVSPHLPELARGQRAIEEINVAFDYFSETGDSIGIMLDVGAHHGSSSKRFIDQGWTVHAFEPDSENAAHYKRKFGHIGRVQLNQVAVGESNGFSKIYRSEISSGISSLTPFHETHIEAESVERITLIDYLAGTQVQAVDFLKVDVEGYDLDVLKGFPFSTHSPKVILIEFEFAKTAPRGYTPDSLAEYLIEQGYEVYVFEWYPIEQYGGKHSFRRFYEYGTAPIPDESWGNFLAFRRAPQRAWLNEIVDIHLGISDKSLSGSRDQPQRDIEGRLKAKLEPLFVRIFRRSPSRALLLSKVWSVFWNLARGCR